jgi:hypothetical protein
MLFAGFPGLTPWAKSCVAPSGSAPARSREVTLGARGLRLEAMSRYRLMAALEAPSPFRLVADVESVSPLGLMTGLVDASPFGLADY